MNIVNVRRPLAYLCAAGVLALGSLLIPTGGSPDDGQLTTTTTGGTGGGSASAPCNEIKESLRPEGPLPAPGQMPEGSTMAAIAERGRLIVGVDQGKLRTGYRDPRTGRLEGADIEIARKIAEAIFGDAERVQFVVLDIADRPAAVDERRVDMVVNSFTITCDRQRLVEFSTAYMEATQRIMVPAGSGIREIEDLAGQKVCTSKGSVPEKVLRELPIKVEVVAPVGIPDCVVELQRGRVAAVSTDDILLAGLAAQDPQTEVVGRALDNAQYGIGVHPGSPDLVRFVNAFLERARADGTLADIYRRWYADVLRPAPTPPAARYRD